ncbi:alpha/beta-type small acid-soluble spore protein [Bacillus carboniphilus]|uniref:Alpha/beta-type small acid-soluble spore protein n=1 Tax=Bacillus carboniphilus TaxID=86663 RepID=A0ABN0VU33_9BACI
MARSRNKLLVPEAREGLNQLKGRVMAKNGYSSGNDGVPNNVKYEVAKEVGVPLNNGYNGDIKAKDAGKIGGNIGGKMVREMVKMAEEQLKKQ